MSDIHVAVAVWDRVEEGYPISCILFELGALSIHVDALVEYVMLPGDVDELREERRMANDWVRVLELVTFWHLSGLAEDGAFSDSG